MINQFGPMDTQDSDTMDDFKDMVSNQIEDDYESYEDPYDSYSDDEEG